ncbi:MAG: 23S rRNA (uracil(1939)-C(5))-methyltransferase RlmD [Bacteroidales bacterium]|nr:23S rRNA (uracil(1939)-C(5))-methyltransferase RlmD [Bacteroidales bacterium]
MGRKKTELVIENALIEAVAAEGKALAHYEGAVVFVPFAVPGDIVDIKVNRKKRNYMEGFILRMIKPSPMRLEPFCEHFGECGGCKWQPLPYEEQLKAKQQQVYDQLVRIGHLDIPPISPIIGSELTIRYRNKLEYTFSSKRWLHNGENTETIAENDRCGLGFHVGKFFDKVLDIRKCHLQAEPSNAIRLFIKDYAITRSLSFYDIRANSGYLRNLVIRTTEKGNVMLTVVFAYDDPDSRRELLDAVSEAFPQISSLYYVVNEKLNDSLSDQECILYKGEDAICEYMEGLRFRIGPKSFYQTNSRQAYKLYCVTRELAELKGTETVYDLYTGTGTIAQFISPQASKVIGIEYVQEAIADARLNAAANGISNCEFFAGDMKDVLTAGFIEEHGHPDVIILDPPRAGIHPDVAKVILEAAPERMVYVSCNPASQARDLAVFSEAYEIRVVQPVDMFPHTQHVENVCSLTRRK